MNRKQSVCMFLLGLIFIFIGGCDGCNTDSQSEEPMTLEEFCLSIEQEMNFGNFVYLDEHFDVNALLSRVTAGIDAPDYYKEGFTESVLQESVGRLLHEQLGMKGYVKLLKHESDSLESHCFYRMVTDNRIDYLKLELQEQEGTQRIDDFSTFEQINTFSENLRRYYIIYLAEEDTTFSHPSADFIPAIQSIAGLADAGKFEEAQGLYESLPESVKKDKLVLLLQLNLGKDQGTEALNGAIAEYKKYHPNDPLLEHKLMELAYQVDSIPGQISAITQFQHAIGGDPYLDFMKAVVLLGSDDTQEAEKFLRHSIGAEPENDEPYWVLIDLLVKQERYPEVIDVFASVQENFEINPAEYVIYDGYKDFYASEAFRNWVLEHPMEDTLNINLDSIEQSLENMQHHHGHDHSHDHAH